MTTETKAQRDKDKKHRINIAWSMLLGPLGMIAGALVLTWMLTGPVLYGEENHVVKAKILGNGVGAMTGSDTRDHHFLVLEYQECKGVQEGLLLPSLEGLKPSKKKIVAQYRACLEKLTADADIDVGVRVRRTRLTGNRVWQIQTVGVCETQYFSRAIKADAAAKRCTWMGDSGS